MTLVRILWRDAYDHKAGDWIAAADEFTVIEDCIIETVGHVVGETDLFVAISHSRYSAVPDTVRGGFVIPKVCIVERSVITCDVLATTSTD